MTTIASDFVATIHYQLTLDNGSVVDSSFDGEPLTYLQGHGNIVPGLESQLEGKQAGDKLDAVVQPNEGYGDVDPDADHAIARDQFPQDVDLQPGMGFHGEDEQGRTIPLFIKAVEGDQVVITTNHPLAGQRLNFKVEVVSVRAATPEELEHGHVHGAGDHEH
ncbi:MAG: peptidylprolyl isomerase [Planctomycetota bacterium]|nr:peptidylprolyl isomerase [Planctomycetota bacterium]